MDLSTPKQQDPAQPPSHGERRRRIRHRLHTPVYASFSGPHTGMVLDLSELLDVHEDGFAVQTSEQLELNRPLSICLDLPETKSFIHASGHVVWSDGGGRGGIRFSALPDDSRRQLKEWLFVNVLTACTHQAARALQLAQSVKETPTALPIWNSEALSPVPDLSGMLSAVEAVLRESRTLGGDFDAVLQLVTERAAGLTGASGAALAFATAGELICRARAGEPAPPLGARVDARHGLTGECVRRGQLITCEDTETDPRVNREICRELGIGSILAVPILADFRVAGLIEVFSPRPRAFTKTHETVLDRLVEIVPKEPAHVPVAVEVVLPESEAVSVARPGAALPETETEAQESLTGVGVRWVHLVLLGLTAGLVALVLGYVLAPAIQKHWLNQTEESPAVVAASEVSPRAKSAHSVKGNKLAELRTLAESGDPGAQYELGARYHNGDGVVQSDPEAVKWFTRAAEQGHVVSQAMLGYFYWVGQGAPRDINRAYFWSVLARAGGDEASKYRVESLTSNMTRAQAVAIQQEADMWLHEHAGSSQQSQK